MTSWHNKEGGSHLEQESNRQKTAEDIDGGLHPAVGGQSLGERWKVKKKPWCKDYGCSMLLRVIWEWGRMSEVTGTGWEGCLRKTGVDRVVVSVVEKPDCSTLWVTLVWPDWSKRWSIPVSPALREDTSPQDHHVPRWCKHGTNDDGDTRVNTWQGRKPASNSLGNNKNYLSHLIMTQNKHKTKTNKNTPKLNNQQTATKRQKHVWLCPSPFQMVARTTPTSQWWRPPVAIIMANKERSRGRYRL